MSAAVCVYSRQEKFETLEDSNPPFKAMLNKDIISLGFVFQVLTISKNDSLGSMEIQTYALYILVSNFCPFSGPRLKIALFFYYLT